LPEVFRGGVADEKESMKAEHEIETVCGRCGTLARTQLFALPATMPPTRNGRLVLDACPSCPPATQETIAALTIAAANSLRRQIEEQCRALGEEEIRRMVANGWGLVQWITDDGTTLTLHAQVRPQELLPEVSVQITGLPR
jgi:hypothetical protein